MKKFPTWLGHIIAAILSFLAAFFSIFNVLFSDIFRISQQAGAVLYVFVIYLVFSLVLHWLWPNRGKAWRVWLVIPGGVIGVLITLGDAIRALYLLAVLVGMVLGTWLGWRVFRRRQAV